MKMIKWYSLMSRWLWSFFVFDIKTTCMACLARYLCTPKLETLVDPLSTFKLFFLLFPSALTPNNFRTEGSVKKKYFFLSFFPLRSFFRQSDSNSGWLGAKPERFHCVMPSPEQLWAGRIGEAFPISTENQDRDFFFVPILILHWDRGARTSSKLGWKSPIYSNFRDKSRDK